MTQNRPSQGLRATSLLPGLALIAASLLLPAFLFASAAWLSYREILHAAETQVERTVHLLEEHALKVFETNRLVIDQINGRIRFMDWSLEADRLDLHKLMDRLQADLDQISTITITDADGRMRASGRVYPADSSISFADRDYFQALKASDSVLPYVSRTYKGRQSGVAVFNFAGRTPPGPGGAFSGVIAVSADRAYFEHFYQSVDPTVNHSVILVRDDGFILATVPALPIARLPDDSALRNQIHVAPTGAYTRVSRLDGVERIFAYRKIGGYPVFVRFGLDKAAALAPWRMTLVNYGLVASLGAILLVAASSVAIRQSHRERVARQLWEDTAAALKTEALERERVEQQLRQSQKMEAVGRLTGGVAHDFNNLLTAVIGSLDLVLRCATGLEPRVERYIGNALEGAHRAAALTARLLAFSRQQPLQPEQIEPNRLVAGMSDLLRRTLGEAIAVETVLAGGLWRTLVDPNQLENAILNLAVNARDAMPTGGRLTIATANADLDVTEARAAGDVTPGQYVLIAVSDEGTGMAPDIMAKVFEPFFTTKPVGKGTGLGLSQVYGFTKQSGGHVAVASEVGRGSTVTLYLPRCRTMAAAEAAPQPAARATQALASGREADGETILVVEDDRMVRDISVAVLEDAGFRVLAAADGPRAIEIARAHPEIVLLFTDVVLAGPIDGRVLAETILRDRPGLPILFTTGYTRDAIIQDGRLEAGRLEAGLNFIGKPFTGESLIAAVHALIRDRVA